MTRALVVPVALLFLLPFQTARADNNITVVKKLTNDNVYIAPSVISAGHASHGDQRRLQRVVDDAGRHSVPVKVALLTRYPRNLRNAHDAAARLRSFIDFSGVLVLVSPHGMGVSSDYLSNDKTLAIERQAATTCSASYTACAIKAVRAAVPRVQAEQATANRNVAVFWAVAVTIFGVVIAALVLVARRKQAAILASREDASADELPASPTSESR